MNGTGSDGHKCNDRTCDNCGRCTTCEYHRWGCRNGKAKADYDKHDRVVSKPPGRGGPGHGEQAVSRDRDERVALKLRSYAHVLPGEYQCHMCNLPSCTVVPFGGPNADEYGDTMLCRDCVAQLAMVLQAAGKL